KDKEEGLGWASEGWTAEKAYDRRREITENIKNAEGPQTLAEKRELLREQKETEKAAKARAEKENVTFSDYFNDVYFPAYKIGRKKSTSRKAKEHFKNWIEPVIGNIPLKDIRLFNVEKIKKNVLEAGKSPRTLQYIFATIRQAWNTARLNGLVVSDSPTKQTKIQKVDNKRVRFLSYDEADQLLTALKEKDALTYNISLLSLQTGLRFGEIANLKWGHVDIDRGIIDVVDPKGVTGRAAYMTGKLKAMFDKMTRRKPNDYVFIKDGEQLKDTPKDFFKIVAELGFNIDVTDSRRKVVFHTLRHTFASWHVMAGTDIYTVKKLMGHSNISMTERYSHLAPEALQNATRTLEKAINRAGHSKKTGQVVNFKK
ncbi:MAG: tyrosine-type recombinase/integrase, partial [Smithella sp.]